MRPNRGVNVLASSKTKRHVLLFGGGRATVQAALVFALAVTATLLVSCDSKPETRTARREIQQWFEKSFESGRFSHAWHVDAVEKINGWQATANGTPAYVVLAKLHVTVDAPAEYEFETVPPHTFLSELVGPRGAKKTSRAVEWLYTKTENGWRFEGLTEKEMSDIHRAEIAVTSERPRVLITVARICEIDTAWENYAVDHNTFAVTSDPDDRTPTAGPGDTHIPQVTTCAAVHPRRVLLSGCGEAAEDARTGAQW